MQRLITRAIGLAAVAVALAGCSKPDVTAGRQVVTVSGADAMVIEVSIGGGLAPPQVRVSDSMPRIWIGADGRYLRQTPTTDGDPALVAVEERLIPDAGLAGLVADARAAGLLADDPDYGKPGVADAMVTRFVVVDGGKRHVVLVSALGYPNLDLAPAVVAARARLSQFLDVLQHPEKIAGIGLPTPYTPRAIAVFILGAATTPASAPPAVWPLGDLGTTGARIDWPVAQTRCEVITGDAVTSVVAAGAGQDRFAPWRSADGLWQVALRPLLPDEDGCNDVID